MEDAMRIPGITREDRVVDTPYLERRPGETREAFEARMAAAAEARDRGVAPAEATVADRRDAYAQGRRDERRRERRVERERPRRRGGFGLLGLVVVLVAALGVVWLALAVREGSFAAGGAVVDQKVASVTQPAVDAANRAVDRTGQAVENAGQALENQGQRLQEQAR
jgi:hypothetical protein